MFHSILIQDHVGSRENQQEAVVSWATIPVGLSPQVRIHPAHINP